MTYQKYPKYKASEKHWLSEIPEHWQIWPLKWLAEIRLSNVDKHTVEDQKLVLLCNYMDVYKNERITGDLPFMQASASDQQIERLSLKKDDVIITKDSESPDDIGVSAIVNDELEGVVCGYHLALLRPLNTVALGAYIHRGLHSTFVRSQFLIAAVGMTRFGLGKYDIENALLPVPPLDEQACITLFIDHETAEIDALIAKQEQLIIVLQQKRQALISHVITKGIDPTVPLRSNGVEWLKEIPNHWQIKRLKYLTSEITVGIVVTPAKHYVDEGIPALRSLNIKERAIKPLDLVYISPESNQELSKSMICAGDLVSVRTGQPGTTAVVDERFHECNCIDLIIIRRSPLFNSDFMAYYLNSYPAKHQYGSGSGGAIQQHFNVTTAKSLLVVSPPIEEQQEIVAYLDQQIAKLDKLVAKARQACIVLQERRSALITAAVTGQIDVRSIKKDPR